MDSFWKCLSSIGERYTAPRNEVRSALLAKAIRRELLASLPSDYDRFDEDARLEELDKYVCPRPDYVAAALMLPSMKTYSLDALPVSPNQFRAIEALKADWQLRISTDEAELHENFDEAKEFADNGLTSLAYAPLRLVLISMPAALARAEDDASKTQLLGLLQLARRLAFDVEMAENFLLPAATIADLLLPECDPAVGDGYAIWHKTLKLLALLAMPVDTSTLSDAFVSGQQREAAMHLWELLCQASKAPNFWDAGRWADARHRNSLRSTSAQTAATLLAMQQRACPEFIARSLPSMHGMRFVGGRYAWMDAVATRQEFRSLYSPLPNRVEDLLQSMKAFERTGERGAAPLLFCSAPGFGKTTFLRHLLEYVDEESSSEDASARGWAAPVLTRFIQADDVMGQYFNESRSKTSRLLQGLQDAAADHSTVALVVVDEVERFLGQVHAGGDPENIRILHEWSQWFDNSIPGNRVYLIAATNDLEKMHPSARSRLLSGRVDYSAVPSVYRRLFSRQSFCQELTSFCVGTALEPRYIDPVVRAASTLPTSQQTRSIFAGLIAHLRTRKEGCQEQPSYMLPASTSSTGLAAVRSDKEPIVHSAIREVAGPSAAQRIIRFAVHDQGYLQGIRQQHQWGPQEAGPLYLGMAGTLENSILLFAVKSHFYALATDPVATKQLFCRAAQNYSAFEELEKKPMPWDKAKRVGELISIQALTVPPTKAGHDWLMVDVYVHELATPAAGADPLHAGRTLWYDRSA